MTDQNRNPGLELPGHDLRLAAQTDNTTSTRMGKPNKILTPSDISGKDTRLPQALLELYRARFINSPTTWFKQWVDDEGACQYACQDPTKKWYRAVDLNLVEAHLTSRVTVSWPAINEPGDTATSRWLCFDCDTGHGALNRLEDSCRHFEWPVLREGKRPGRDGHCWIFFTEPIPTSDVILIGRRILTSAEVTEADKIEVFPKWANRWSQVRGPLGFHKKPGAECWSRFDDCPEMDTVEQLLWLGEQSVVDAESAIHIAREIQSEEPLPARVSPKTPRDYDQTAIKRTAAEVAGRFEKTKVTRRGYLIQCPAHDDQHASLEIWDGHTNLLFNCYAGCNTRTVMQALRQMGAL